MIIHIYKNFGAQSDGISRVLMGMAGVRGVLVLRKFPVFNLAQARRNTFVLHGCYSLDLLYAALMARMTRSIFFWCPHGSFQLNSLVKSNLKKRIYHKIVSKLIIKLSKGVVFVSMGEAEKSSWIVRDSPFFIIPNAVNSVDEDLSLHRNEVTYVGRIDGSPKGIDRIIDWLSDWKGVVSLYGPNSSNYDGSFGSVCIRGSLTADEVDKVLQRTKVFIIFSRYEGLPMSALEALASGCIVLCTPETNLGEYVVKHGCGFVVRNKAEAVSALNYIFSSENADRILRMHNNAMRLARSEFSLERQVASYRSLDCISSEKMGV